MFPIPWNKAYRKKDGSLTIIDDMFVDAPELQEEIDILDGKIDDVADSITPISQAGTKATTAITAGTQFYLNGNLVKAKTNIAIDDTFTSGTNYEPADDITTQISSIESNLLRLDGKWVLDTAGNYMDLAVGDSVKTVSALLAEAQTAFAKISIPSGYAYEFMYMSVPVGDGTSSRVHLDISTAGLGGKLLTSTSGSSLTASRTSISTTNSTISMASLGIICRCGTANIASNGAVTFTDYGNSKPSNGTKLQLFYNIWKQI